MPWISCLGFCMHIEKIVLERVDRKLWSFKGNAPVRVELAVLEYLEAQGWEGYFTEHWNFEDMCIALMSWPNTRKVMPKDVSTLEVIFYMGVDGWLKKHNFSFPEVMSCLESFDASAFGRVCRAQMKSKAPRFLVGKAGHKARSFSEVDLEKLERFFCVAGRDFFVTRARSRFTLQELIDRTEVYQIESAISDFQRDQKLIRPTSFPKAGLGHAAFHSTSRYDGIIEEWRQVASSQLDTTVASIILTGCKIAEAARIRTLSEAQNVLLDLRVWRDRTQAFVEVKAPNDRLSNVQRATISNLEKSEHSVWVVTVEAA